MIPVYFEDIKVGTEFRSERRTVTEADIVNFCGISGDFDALHTDEIFAQEQTPFRGRIAHGLLVLAISSGLRCELANWRVLAYVDEGRRFLAPTYPGDTICVRYRVDETRPSASRPDCGVITLFCEVVNHDDVVVQSGVDIYLVSKRSPTDSDADAA